MPFLWTALVMGLAGSMHCILMCGPLVTGLNPARSGMPGLWFRNILYQCGRITSYLVIGLVFGAVGKLVSILFYQQLLSVISGMLLLLWGGFFVIEGVTGGSRAMRIWSKTVSGFFPALRKKKSRASVFALGILNGFLPCGMVYMAATASLNNGSIVYSLLFMLLFGLGTIPAMSGAIMSRSLIPLKWRFSLRKFSPYILTAMGLLFVLRGMNLDIPYVSPHIVQNHKGEVPSCFANPNKRMP